MKSNLHEVTKAQFKEMYFRHGSEANGWGQEYWNRFYEEDKIPPMKYKLKEPESIQHSRMMIIYDSTEHEYRMFFTTEDEEERFFGR